MKKKLRKSGLPLVRSNDLKWDIIPILLLVYDTSCLAWGKGNEIFPLSFAFCSPKGHGFYELSVTGRLISTNYSVHCQLIEELFVYAEASTKKYQPHLCTHKAGVSTFFPDWVVHITWVTSETWHPSQMEPQPKALARVTQQSFMEMIVKDTLMPHWLIQVVEIMTDWEWENKCSEVHYWTCSDVGLQVRVLWLFL